MIEKPLAGRVALVAGATRGAGRGIAVELGAAGATVYCTGRTTRARRSPYNRPETIEQTAELVDAAGGHGIAVQVDHMQVDQVRDLVLRIDDEQDGRIDILVNDVWGGQGELTRNIHLPFWQHDLPRTLETVRNAVDTHIITSWFVMPLMVRRDHGLIVGVTDGDPGVYHDNLFYDLAKKNVMRLAYAYGEEGSAHGITGVAISPGWLRSEEMLEEHGVTEDNWQDYYWNNPGQVPRHWLASESPRFTGRAVVALASDPGVARWNRETVYVNHLASHYGFTDVDGSRPGHGIHALDYLDNHEPHRDRYRRGRPAGE